MDLAQIKNGANAASALLPSPTDGIGHATAPDTIGERTDDCDDPPPEEPDMSDDDPSDDFDRYWSLDELDPKSHQNHAPSSTNSPPTLSNALIPPPSRPLASAVYTPALDQISRDLQVTQPSLLHLSVSAYILGFAAGPLLVSPISGLSGRLPIFRIGSVFFALLNLMCVFSSSIDVLIVLRFLAGVAGSTPMALGPATVVDLFHKEERGKALSLMAVGAVCGPMLGPSLGGFIAQSVGWRGCFVMLFCVLTRATIVQTSFNAFLTLIWMQETSLTAIRKNHHLSLQFDVEESTLLQKPPSPLSLGDAPRTILNATLRPIVICSRRDILPAILVGSFFYCLQVWLYIDIPLTYKAAYGFSTRRAGVIFMALGLGMILGLMAFGLASDKMMVRMAHGGDRRPEHRLPFLAASICILTLGMATYTLGTKLMVVWLVSAIGNVIMGAGLFCITVSVLPKTKQHKMSISSYVLDVSPQDAVASAAALSVVRFVSGAFFPVMAQKLEAMISAEAVHWGLTATSALIMIVVLSWMLLLFRRTRLSDM
ncbi:hypothetical protein NM208_g7502 [Fusarium decemcellulare]|uniref:Uncharacterized protein n=1 Tax=Fusarium decemcellulare TaxID=57161 RepID=A0ACC1S8S7_9HYPO|nr:hypothetical protein NM208_g7502 [Fusarium decemcellulare]